MQIQMQVATYGISIIILGLILWRRTRAMVRPIRGAGFRILIPMLFMSPAISMFMNPQIHMTFIQILVAAMFGVLLSLPMTYTTNYEIREDGKIYAVKSIAFVFALLSVFIVRRIAGHFVPGVDGMTLTTLSMVSVFVYVIIWRIISFIKFRKVYNSSLSV